MKTILLCLLFSIGFAVAATAADVSGKWTGTFMPESGEDSSAYVILKQSGATITGSGGPNAEEQWPGLEGTISGNRVSLQVKSADDGTVYKCDLVLDGDHLKGDVILTLANGQSAKGLLVLTRVPE